MIGRVLSGRYEIQAVVGTGGMAVVYRAWDKTEKRTVAIKVLRPEYEQDAEFVRRFSREAEAAAKMSHENIVNLLAVNIYLYQPLMGLVILLAIVLEAYKNRKL